MAYQTAENRFIADAAGLAVAAALLCEQQPQWVAKAFGTDGGPIRCVALTCSKAVLHRELPNWLGSLVVDYDTITTKRHRKETLTKTEERLYGGFVRQYERWRPQRGAGIPDDTDRAAEAAFWGKAHKLLAMWLRDKASMGLPNAQFVPVPGSLMKYDHPAEGCHYRSKPNCKAFVGTRADATRCELKHFVDRKIKFKAAIEAQKGTGVMSEAYTLRGAHWRAAEGVLTNTLDGRPENKRACEEAEPHLCSAWIESLGSYRYLSGDTRDPAKLLFGENRSWLRVVERRRSLRKTVEDGYRVRMIAPPPANLLDLAVIDISREGIAVHTDSVGVLHRDDKVQIQAIGGVNVTGVITAVVKRTDPKDGGDTVGLEITAGQNIFSRMRP